MYISKVKKYRDQGDGMAIAYDYYRLTKSYIDKDGKTKHRSVLCLGELPGFDKDERNRLQVISIRQSTEAESKLSAIYDLLYITPKPLGKRKSMLHPNQTSKNPDIGNQGVT